MNLQVGIVGLPNAGKSTLFNALSSKYLSQTAPRPFTTIDPHEAIVEIPDSKLRKLSFLIKPQETISASVKFIDIAGLVKGAHKGEGLGNQFLAKIREVDAIIHVVRAFKNENVLRTEEIPQTILLDQIIEDIEIVNLELELGNIKGIPTIYVLNVSESDLNQEKTKQLTKKIQEKTKGNVIVICAKLEEEIIDIEKEEREEYLEGFGIKDSGLNKLIKLSYKKLGLISFYTVKGGKEVHAWSIKKGENVLQAAKEVHTDFFENFIKAEAINVDDLLNFNGWKQAKEKGKIRLEGKDYLVENEDVIEFIVGK